jgi:signal transduction histidine kinase
LNTRNAPPSLSRAAVLPLLSRAAAVPLLARAAVRTWRRLTERGRWVLAWRLVPPVGMLGAGVLVALDGRPLAGATCLAMAVALLGRFAWPATALLTGVAATAAGEVLHAAFLGLADGVVLVMLAYAAGRRATTARRSALAAGSAAVADFLRAVATDDSGLGRQALAFDAVSAILLILLPAALGLLVGERERGVTALRERNLLLERAQQLGDLRARMQERARIAGEMHDLIGHRLSLITLHAGALEMRTREQSPEVSKQADLLRTTSRAALDELREVLGILRLDGVGPEEGNEAVGTRADVTGLVDESRGAGLPISLDWSGGDLGEIDLRIRRAVHRIVRESLTNVHKHAPGAPTRLSVVVDDRHIAIELRNALRPPATPVGGTGLGLVGLRERARLAGGTYVAAVDRSGGEFVVSAELPTKPTDIGAGPEEPGDLPTPATAPGDGGTLPARGLSKVSKVVVAVIVAVVLTVCGGSVWGLYHLMQLTHDTVTAQTYQQITKGDSREHVRQLTGGSHTLAREEVKEHQPPVPPGAACDYSLSKSLDFVYRFCFVNGVLVQKDQIDADGKTDD